MNAMGRLNASMEIIPLQGPSDTRKNEFRFKTNIRPRPTSKYPYFVDPQIVPRVKQYLEEHKDSVYVDVNAMVDDLQKRYRDYSRRKRSAFKQTVEKAFSVVLQQYGLSNDFSVDGDDGVKTESSEDDTCAEEVSHEGVNVSAGQIMNMYMNRGNARKNSAGDGDKELINISSDDDDAVGGHRDDDDVVRPGFKSKQNQGNNAPGNTATTASAVTIASSIPTSSDTLSQISDILRSKSITVTSTSGAKLPSANTQRPVQPSVTCGQAPVTSTPVNPTRMKKRKAVVGLDNSLVKRKREVPLQESKITFQDIGGVSGVLEEVSKLLIHIRHPEVYKQLGIPPPRGFLLHGPPGCGKSLLAHAIAGELGLPLVKVAAPELVAGVSGESEERIRELFEQAVEMAPCVLFLDEVDAIAPHRMSAQREMERRIVAQLLSCLDELGRVDGGTEVLVVGATNRPDALDPALRRAGRFDREVCLGIPDQKARVEILHVLCSHLRLCPNLDLRHIAQQTPGFVGADLSSLIREAALAAVNRVFTELQNSSNITQNTISNEETAKDSKKEKERVVESKNKETTPEEVIDITDRDVLGDAEKKDKPKETATPQKTESVTENKDKKNPASKGSGSGDGGDDDDEIQIEAEVNNDETSGNVSMEVDEAPEQEAERPGILNTHEVEVISQVGNEKTAPRTLSWLCQQPPLTDAQLRKLFITKVDFECALKCVQPSAKREGFATVPDVTWDDVGSLKEIREELKMAILAPVQHPEKFEALGLTTPTGLLLCGPPGCGKTLLAKAIANEAGINFISVKGPELLNMYVGESEKAVRQCFQRARNSAPCVIFFDELDALCPKRSDSREGGPTMRVVNQMLTEMDGVEGRRGVFLLAASNRPDIIDPAVLRPGRLDKILYVGLPGPNDRADILHALTKGGTKPRLASDVDLKVLGSSMSLTGYTGADLAALVREAGIDALREYMETKTTSDLVVTQKHFDSAIKRIRPSVPEKDQRKYEELRRQYTAVPSTKSNECPQICNSTLQTPGNTIPASLPEAVDTPKISNEG